jgi:hypothetical protein
MKVLFTVEHVEEQENVQTVLRAAGENETTQENIQKWI